MTRTPLKNAGEIPASVTLGVDDKILASVSGQSRRVGPDEISAWLEAAGVAIPTEVVANPAAVTYTGDGTTTAFDLPDTAISINNLGVYIDGIKQYPTEFFLAGGQIIFNSAPRAGEKIRLEGAPRVPVGTASASIAILDGGEDMQSYVNRAGAYPTFASFAAVANTLAWSDGAVVWADGIPYRREAGASSVAGAPNWTNVTIDGGTF